MKKREILLRLQQEFNDTAPNIRKICDLMIELGMESDLKNCFSIDDLKSLWQRIKII